MTARLKSIAMAILLFCCAPMLQARIGETELECNLRLGFPLMLQVRELRTWLVESLDLLVEEKPMKPVLRLNW